MAWNEERARSRIIKHRGTVPELDDGVSLARSRALAADSARMAKSQGNFPRGRAVLVRGVHLYGVLLDFDNLVADQSGDETERSHTQVLRFLDTHYSVWDRVVDGNGALRVDYHGPRLHAVVTDPEGNPREQLLRAIALAAKLTEAAKRVAMANGFPARIRFGIDIGPCLALTTGRAHESDTLFLGAPANHAAKLAAAPRIEGIFLTENAQAVLSAGSTMRFSAGALDASSPVLRDAIARNQFAGITAAADALVKSGPRQVQFTFHRARPPLSSIKFSELSASNSVRMGMSSIFADIDGYTKFVDAAINGGSQAIKVAVEIIHVLREELNDVLRSDFDGKRVRFIGDCIHGILSEGASVDDPAGSVRTAAMCASAMRSSVDLCKSIIPGMSALDLAVGVEFGVVPVTRIGDRGVDGVRCAAGKAVVVSEQMQQSIEHGGVVLGPTATKVADDQVRVHYARGKRLLGYDAAADLLRAPSSPVAVSIIRNPAARPHAR